MSFRALVSTALILLLKSCGVMALLAAVEVHAIDKIMPAARYRFPGEITTGPITFVPSTPGRGVYASDKLTEHTFAVYNDSGGGMKQVISVENNGDGGLNGTPTDVNFRNLVLNMGDPNASSSGQVPIIFMSPSGTSTYNVISIMKSGENTDGQAVFTVNSLGALTMRSGGTSSTAASLCATSDTSCSSPRWRMDEFGRQLWTRNIEQAVTIADNGAGTAAAATLTPTTSYINITCNDANGCDVTMGETGAVTSTAIQITNVSSNTVNFADSSGVSETAGAFAAGQWDNITFRYNTDRWVETGRSNN